jgi:hypothetical protein
MYFVFSCTASSIIACTVGQLYEKMPANFHSVINQWFSFECDMCMHDSMVCTIDVINYAIGGD